MNISDCVEDIHAMLLRGLLIGIPIEAPTEGLFEYDPQKSARMGYINERKNKYRYSTVDSK